MLNFVERGRKRQAGKETIGVASGSGQYPRVVEGNVVAAIFRYFLGLDQRALSGLTSAIDENGRGICKCVGKLACEIATEHDSITIHMVVDNQPRDGWLSARFEYPPDEEMWVFLWVYSFKKVRNCG